MKKFHNNIAANDQSEFSFNHEVKINNQVSLVKPTSLLALSLTATHSLATPTIPAVLLETNIDSPTHVNHEKIIQPELMIIDSRLQNIDNLIQRRRKGLIPIVVKENENGLDAISQAMLKYPNAKTVHVISHGAPGEILLGNSNINEDQLNTHTGAFHQWRNDKVLARPDLIVYGCNVAKGQVGQDFINKLSLVTGFDVAASTDLTGQTNLGGDWDLESTTGWIDATLAWQESDIEQIQGVLVNYTVNSLLDSGAGTLRDALDNLVADGDTIDFSVTGTITLTSAELTIANNITITGPGAANLSIDGADNFRVLDINTGLNVTISDVTITRGNASGNGGGIRSYANYLTINNAVISNNTTTYDGGGLNHSYNESILVMSNVTMENNSAGDDGGAVHAYVYDGSFSITDSNLSNNQSYDDGGGIFLNSYYSSATLTNVTMDNNISGDDGGGLKVSGKDNSLTIRDSFISNNSASTDGGGLSFGENYGTLLIDNTTITGNYAGDDGGGVYLYIEDYNGVFTIQNSTISNNTADGNGGGIAVYADSVYKGYGDDGSLTIDNVTISGNTAIADGGGIWLYGEEDFIPTTIQNSTITNNYANYDGGGVFFKNDYGYATLDITNNTISNNEASDYGGGINIEHETFGSDVVISNNIIDNNQASNGSGGGINVRHPENLNSDPYGSLTLTNNQITNNTAYRNGGGVALYQGGGDGYSLPPLTITGGAINNNTAENGDGGGLSIFARGSTRSIMIDGATFDGNTADDNGGGISINVDDYGLDNDAIIQNSTISNNITTNGTGGGISIFIDEDYAGELKIINSTISGNTAQNNSGGGIRHDGSQLLEIISSTITNNTAQNAGGGLYIDEDVTMHNSIVANNASASTVFNDFYNSSNFSVSSSLISDATNGTFNDIANNILNTDPLLSPLQNNGGPTFSHQLMAGSSAIDVGDNGLNTEVNDQRGAGFPRVLNTTIDMGAVEGGLPAIDAAAILSSITVVETAGVVTYTINLDMPAPTAGVTIDLSFAGTAINGVDYTASGVQIFIPAGANSGFITFNIIDDGLNEPDETIVINIDAIANATVSGPASATVTILAAMAGPPAIIPSLSSWSTLLLSLLLPAFVMRRFRKRRKVEITYQ